MAADGAFGTTIVFGTTGWTALITGVNQDGISRAELDTSHHGTTNGWKTFIPSDLKDAGVVSLEFHFNPDDAPPIDQAAETITITFPVPSGLTNGATFACNGFMNNFTFGTPFEELLVGTSTLKLSGEPTWADAT